MMSEVKKTFIEQILEFVNGGEEVNVKNILKVATKKWNKQILLKKRAIKDIEEKLVETLEEQADYRSDDLTAYKESFLSVDVEVKGRDAIVAYVRDTYEQQISDAKYNLNKRDSRIDDFKANAASAIRNLEKEIKDYEGFLAEVA